MVIIKNLKNQNIKTRQNSWKLKFKKKKGNNTISISGHFIQFEYSIMNTFFWFVNLKYFFCGLMIRLL